MRCERGSIAPLGIGLAIISLATILTFATTSSMFILHRRLVTLAEATSLTVAANGNSAQDFLTGAGVLNFKDLKIQRVEVLDGVTTEVTLCATWENPILVIGLPKSRVVCGSGAAR